MSNFVCACGELVLNEIQEIGGDFISTVELHSLQCKEALSGETDERLDRMAKEGPPFYGEETRWWYENGEGLVLSLHACHMVAFETPADGLYLKVYDEGKSSPRQIIKGEVVFVGENRRQDERQQLDHGCVHTVFQPGWEEEPIAHG